MALESVINYVIKTRTDLWLICPSEKYWPLVLLQGILAVLILLFRILISSLVYSTLDIFSPCGVNTNTLLWLAFIWSLPINNLCYNVWIFPCYPIYAHQNCSKAISTVFKESRPWQNNKSFDFISRILRDHMKP